jgi:hypothetical protein
MTPSVVARTLPARVVLAEGDAVAGSTVSSLNAPFTNGLGQVGFNFGLLDGVRGIWFDDGVRFLSSDALPTLLGGGESTMGIGNGGEFIYSPSIDGQDGVWGDGGLILVEETPAPDFPIGTITTFHSRPQMVDDGGAYWVSGFNESGGTATEGRMLYHRPPSGGIRVVLRSDDLVDGLPVARSDGIGFDYWVSGDGVHLISEVLVETGSSSDDARVQVDGMAVAAEGGPSGDGDNWQSFDAVSINGAGNYLFSGDTDGAVESDEYIAYNAAIALREGAVVDGITLVSTASVRGLSINELGQAVHAWRVDDGSEYLFLAEDAADLASSSLLLATGDELDVDGDELPDLQVTGVAGSGVVGPSLDLAEDGYLYVGVDVVPVGGGAEIEAIVRLELSSPKPGLYRSSVAALSAGWQAQVPLPLTPASSIDPGWPRAMDVPGSLVDDQVLGASEPLALYRLLDAAGAPLPNGLSVAKDGAGGVVIAY